MLHTLCEEESLFWPLASVFLSWLGGFLGCCDCASPVLALVVDHVTNQELSLVSIGSHSGLSDPAMDILIRDILEAAACGRKIFLCLFYVEIKK